MTFCETKIILFQKSFCQLMLLKIKYLFSKTTSITQTSIIVRFVQHVYILNPNLRVGRLTLHIMASSV
jgi:hypothetical protein